MSNEEQEPGVMTAKQLNQLQRNRRDARGKLKLRNILARALLVLFFAIGFFLSVFPQGRVVVRTLLVLPDFLSASQPGLLAPVEEPIQHVKETIPSLNGTVYLDIYAPTTPPPPIPGARDGLVPIPGLANDRPGPQLINFSESLARPGL